MGKSPVEPQGAPLSTRRRSRQAPAGEGQAELLPDGGGGDEAPGAAGGKPGSRASRRCTRRSTGASSPSHAPGWGSSPSRPSATSRGARPRGPCRPRPAAAGAGPRPALASQRWMARSEGTARPGPAGGKWRRIRPAPQLGARGAAPGPPGSSRGTGPRRPGRPDKRAEIAAAPRRRKPATSRRTVEPGRPSDAAIWPAPRPLFPEPESGPDGSADGDGPSRHRSNLRRGHPLGSTISVLLLPSSRLISGVSG